ncbi:S66 family peptidase [Ureibacillus sinduriensis]|uniref:Peptidase S66 n=1 Tax=Ureibacillus sinduriensis BLB-1 = JCM 15800 TaxID=1384057 RepID=A0A0A3I3T8_9BACL|nr:S66 peptidase family protein [Ureibacillus sinduriensis]KGR77318.1 peptidase S66 [Ureibacillus sinduriensis BLB-1 = JCM 15800]
MIRYPSLSKPIRVGVTAPSSGLHLDEHPFLEEAVYRMESKGYHFKIGQTCWTQYKAKSAPAEVRAAELNSMLQDDSLQLIFPPWGGELLIEILGLIDFENIKPKWILGYSDISVLLLAMTLKTGIATAHGPNLVDLRGQTSDPTTAMWEKVLSTKVGEEIIQYPSELYQLRWQHDYVTDWIYHLTEPTKWKTINNTPIHIKGRLLGGCIDVIRHLIGTPFGDIGRFQKKYINNEPIIWYLENCELTVTDLRRSLIQMKLAGWFERCSGILFGRSNANETVNDYHVLDVYMELAEELNVPIAYDMDCGHLPPQLTFINGAYAEVRIYNNNGNMVKQIFM